MSPLDALAGWAAANEDQLRAFVDQLDELVADGVPAAIEVAERMRKLSSVGWQIGFEQGHECMRGPLSPNLVLESCYERFADPFASEAGGSDGS